MKILKKIFNKKKMKKNIKEIIFGKTRRDKLIRVGILLSLVTVYNSFYIVNENQMAIINRFGINHSEKINPGLKFKLPFIDNVRKIDMRIKGYSDNGRYLTADKKNIDVSYHINWKVRGRSSSEVKQIEKNMINRVNDEIRQEIRNTDLQGLLSDKYTYRQIITGVCNKNNSSSEAELDVIDVNITNIKLGIEIESAIKRRMMAEKERISIDEISMGKEQAQEIRVVSETDKSVILSEAYRKSEILKGEGDAQAAKIYAGSYDKDKDFYGFYKTINKWNGKLNCQNQDNIKKYLNN
jgi:modulator of FtsH protease HflC